MGNSLDARQVRHIGRVLETIETGSASARSVIAASWTRSFHVHKLAPDEDREADRCDGAELALRQERAGRLLRVAEPTVERLFATLRLAGCSVVLCDADGVVLHDRRRDGDAADFERAGLTPGSLWSEQARGTNGIGTCLADKRRAVVLKDQHYQARNIGMSCFGAPVFDTSGEPQAVLDVSTCRDHLDPAMQALIEQAVLDAAAQIEADHFCDTHADLRIIRAAQDAARAPSLLAVDACDLVVGATHAARRRFGLPLDRELSPMPAADLLGDAKHRGSGLESAERRELTRALARAGGNMSAAARALGVSRATLYRRMARAGLGADTGQSAGPGPDLSQG